MVKNGVGYGTVEGGSREMQSPRVKVYGNERGELGRVTAAVATSCSPLQLPPQKLLKNFALPKNKATFI